MPRLAAAMLLAFATTSGAQAQTAQNGVKDGVYTGLIATRWGRAVTADNVWQSYPRPQMKRTTSGVSQPSAANSTTHTANRKCQ